MEGRIWKKEGAWEGGGSGCVGGWGEGGGGAKYNCSDGEGLCILRLGGGGRGWMFGLQSVIFNVLYPNLWLMTASEGDNQLLLLLSPTEAIWGRGWMYEASSFKFIILFVL